MWSHKLSFCVSYKSIEYITEVTSGISLETTAEFEMSNGIDLSLSAKAKVMSESANRTSNGKEAEFSAGDFGVSLSGKLGFRYSHEIIEKLTQKDTSMHSETIVHIIETFFIVILFGKVDFKCL